MKRAGYIQKVGYSAEDSAGNKHRILEINISGHTFAVAAGDIGMLLHSGKSTLVWSIKQNWGKFFNKPSGTAELSQSKKAVNLRMYDGKRYTISAAALRPILLGHSTYTSVCEIEPMSYKKSVTVSSAQIASASSGQSLITAWASAR